MRKNEKARSIRLRIALGIPFGTAWARLRKELLFSLAQKLNLATCFRCAKLIETAKEFSVDHKKPWENTGREKELFFDMANIAFSHLSCNCAIAKRTMRKYESKQQKQRAKDARIAADPERRERKNELRRQRRAAARKRK